MPETMARLFVVTLVLLAAPVQAGEPLRPPVTSLPASPPTTAEVLGRLRASNQKQLEAGKLAKKHGNGKAVKDLGAMLVEDNETVEKQIADLAKQEGIDLGAATPAVAGTMAQVQAGAAFDATFARTMAEDQKRQIARATEARDGTTDDKLKQLLTKLIPMLQKHQDAAQKILDTTPR